jgi:hypothetical protein
MTACTGLATALFLTIAPLSSTSSIAGGLNTAALDIVNRDAMHAQQAQREIRFALYDNYLSGVLASQVPVTATLIAPDGVVKARLGQRTKETGSFTIRFLGTGAYDRSFIEPGDSIQIDEAGDGDPIRIEVPSIEVNVDPRRDRIEGSAKPYAQLRLLAESPTQATDIASGTADAGGHFEFDLSGRFDVLPGMNGRLEMALDERTTVYAGWSAVRLELEFRDARVRVRGNAPIGHPVVIEYRTADGHAIGRHELRAGPLFSLWATEIHDDAGLPIRPMAGDRVAAILGSTRTEVILPPFRVAVDVQHDRVVGQTLPDHELELLLSHAVLHNGQRASEAKLRTDANGNFEWKPAQDFDILHRDRLLVGLETEDQHRFEWQQSAAGLVLDRSAGQVTAIVSPLEEVRLSLLDVGGQTRGIWHARADSIGAVSIPLEGSPGNPILPNAEELILLADSTSKLITSLQVPAFDLRIDEERARFEGSATGGGSLVVYVDEGFVRRRYSFGGAIADLSRSAQFSIPFSEFIGDPVGSPFEIRPGQVIQVSQYLPSGNQVLEQRQVPIVSIPLDNALVCGLGEPGSRIEAILQEADQTVAQGQSVVASDRKIRLLLSDGSGSPVASRSGQVVLLSVDGEPIGRWVVPSTVLTVTWSAPPSARYSAIPYTQIEGRLPGATDYRITDRLALDDPCASGMRDMARRAWSDASLPSGQFGAGIGLVEPGQGFEFSFGLPSGHRAHHHRIRPQVLVHVGGDRVEGRATPLTKLEIIIERAGRQLAAGITQADTIGHYALALRTQSGDPVVIAAGDRVRLLADDSSIAVDVAPLTYDFSVEDGLMLYTLPNRTLAVGLVLDDGRVPRMERKSDARGRAYVSPSDIPARSDWDLGDVWRIELLLRTTDGHGMVSEADLRERLSPRRFSTYLPIAQRRF